MPTTPAEKANNRVRHHHHHHRRRRSGQNNANNTTSTSITATSTSATASIHQNQNQHQNPHTPEVVAALAQKSPHPYSSIALSPDRHYAVTASKDTLQILCIRASGLQLVKTLPIAHHFSSSSSNEATTGAAVAGTAGNSRVLLRQQPAYERDSSFGTLFGQTKAPSVAAAAAAAASAHHQAAAMNVVITDVAWSAPQELTSEQKVEDSWQDRAVETDKQRGSHSHYHSHNNATTLIAAAASNGAIVVWNAENLLPQQDSTNKPAVPEAVLRQHVRAVNRLAWHPGTYAGLLLSASQDGKVLLWERRRRENATRNEQQNDPLYQKSASSTAQSSSSSRFHRLFGGTSADDTARPSYTWHCRASFEPKSEAIRDIRWSPFYEDVFGLVTGSGSLIAYNMIYPRRALVKMTAHGGDATTLDWHPKRKGVIATGGAMDRCVKVWDIESLLSLDKDDANLFLNQNTITSRADSIATADSSTDNETTPNMLADMVVSTQPRGASPFSYNPNASRHRGIAQQSLLHVLSISASVTRVRWRPLASDFLLDDSVDDQDRHESMMAVATAPIKGASAGGAGLLMLWSWNRPFMPLSVVEGHSEGAVTDFYWLDTPTAAGPVTPPVTARKTKASSIEKDRTKHEPTKGLFQTTSSRIPGSRSHESDAILFENSEHEDSSDMGLWQHVLSVGRDGRCIIQSFVRGDRPISLVPPSCFTMANLSPFQAGYGSLQIFSLCQNIPSGPRSQFYLTGLRRDIVTASAPGIFREEPLPDEESESVDNVFPDPSLFNRQLPVKVPELHFNVIDQGDLTEDMNPIIENGNAITVAPEVVHVSRFAERYEMYLNEQYRSRVELCMHNAYVAHSLKCEQLAEMWKMIAIMLDNSVTDGLPESGAEGGNVMQFILLPTIRSILEDRADAGDVQTCVCLCEVLQVVAPNETVKIPGLDIEIVREWYLSYIDLLHGMCLFSHATFLIRNTTDPYIAALNKQSTTIHESCPQCGKALSPDGIDSMGETSTSRRLCRSCRRRIGFCFLCHEPVRGIYVWCPGCGHGGHLEHALQWFGGSDGTVREVCPTGCGHKCNMMQRLSAFPRTDSLKDFSPFGDAMDPL